ncbi:amidohydrolase family protein [Pseudidiomarina sp.]|uniref:amidohydrolase family protein n=1 Tax=Pseudidiomarina sp. TaxID=2081707 RepID=UPI00299E8CF9|nr:amidohydrolase family protein [Pseudidiomarina sp.]MDX1705422.1 amidohydrolase family protein [Pseudidiomarina sp.]
MNKLLTALITGALLASASGTVQAEKIALVGGRLIDGTAALPVRDSVILIDDGIIQKVGQRDSLPVPPGYRVVSTEGHDVLPGLWENHAHIQLTGHSDYVHWQSTYQDRFVDEIMPASLVQLLLAGVTSVRDLGAPLEDTRIIKERLETGAIPGPNLYASGPFLQYEVDDWQSHYRWAVPTVDDAITKVNMLADAGMEIVKLIDQDDLPREIAQTIIDQAHKRGMKVVAHAHKPDEIRLGVEMGVDNFEHTGLTTAPEYPEDVMTALKERTATGIFHGLLFWTPTVEGLWSYEETIKNPEHLDDKCWHRGLEADTIADIEQSIEEPGHLSYSQLVPLRKPTLKRKIEQLKESGVVLLIGTDSGIPMKFHCQSTWHEMAVWVDDLGFEPMETIRAATYWPAVMMGVQDRYGSVTEGKVADIIAIRGDVLKYMNLTRDVDMVMKDGVIYKQDGIVNEAALKR